MGLITIDELMLAGARNGYVNKLYYPFSGSTYWTMSPNYFTSALFASNVFFHHSEGSVTSSWVIDGTMGARPVINLNADVEITGGIGTQNEPFVIKTA